MARERSLEQKQQQLLKAATDAVNEHQCITPDYDLDQLLPKCESPIEKLMVESLLLMFSFRHLCDQGSFVGPSRFFSRLPTDEPSSSEFFVGETNFIDAQVEVGQYRADIVVCRWEHHRPEGWLKTPYVVVECDGHDFHERTKEQAQHDKMRDRLMQQAGYCTMRFTGSEVWRDAWGCAEQVSDFLEEKIRAAHAAE